MLRRFVAWCAIAGFSSVLCGQAPRYSESAEYRETLKEISRPDARPTRLGAGTLLHTGATAKVNVRESKTEFVLEGKGWSLSLGRTAFAMELRNGHTEAAWKLAPGGLAWTDASGAVTGTAIRLGKPRHDGETWVVPLVVQGRADEGELVLHMPADGVVQVEVRAPQSLQGAHLRWTWQGGGPFFGLGERFSEQKLDGIETTLHPMDLLGTPGHNWTYIPVPLVYSPQGLGLYLDTGEVTRWDLRDAARGSFAVQMERASTDIYLFGGAGPKQVLESYTALTGRTPLSPPWAFGVWLCAYGAPEIVVGAAERLRKNGIPASALWTFDAMDQGDVMGWPLWRTGYYPNLHAMTDKLHTMGFKSLTYLHPYLRDTLAPYSLPNPLFDMAKEKGWLVHDPAGVPTGPRFEATHDGNIDFTNLTAMEWYGSKVRRILLDNGFDGWMEDYGEWINDTDQFANGSKGRDLQNLYSLLYHKATYTISKDAKPDVVEFVRSGYAGSQGYTRVVWGGDQFPTWDKDSGLPSVVNAGITAGLAGFGVWGPDIEQHGTSKELWARWVEFGALSPIMRDHPWDNPNGATNLWYDAETVALFKKYAGLHVSLFPYFYSFAKEAERTGLPIMRHPMLEYAADTRAAQTEAEYLLGDRLLVAPVVTQGAMTRTLYLPKGEWVDYWTGAAVQGGREVTVDAPMDCIPLLVRAGSVLPFLPEDTQTLAVEADELAKKVVWRVFPGAAESHERFTAYDGAVAMADVLADAVRVRVTGASGTRQTVLVPVAHRPAEVRSAGRVVAEQGTEQGAKQGDGWRYEAGFVRVFVTGSSVDVVVKR